MRVWNDDRGQPTATARSIKGRVIDRIKGGLTVDVGVRAFLPGSLVDIKPVKNLESLRGQGARVQGHQPRPPPQQHRAVAQGRAGEGVREEEGRDPQAAARKACVLKGVVKNITDYGVFIDLGGIDGLLHITDISWGRVNHPSEHFSVGDEVEVVVLKFDPETERVSLGYKQRQRGSLDAGRQEVPGRLARRAARWCRIVDYGAFVELEEGVEGLIHVSEMSWTKKVVNPVEGAHRRRGGRGDRLRARHGPAAHQPVAAPDRAQPVGGARETPPGGHASSKARSATSPSSAPSSRSPRRSTASSTSPT